MLVLDEAAEFRPSVLDSLRQPLESGPIVLHRANGAVSYPARFQHNAFYAVQFTGARGRTYCFSARARDRAGNVSSWSAERCTAILLYDRTLSAAPGWTRGLSTHDYAGTFTRTTLRGARLTLPGAILDRLGVLVVRCPASLQAFGSLPRSPVITTLTSGQPGSFFSS